jgi:alpha-ketoglutarate-dependent taurine dioxygenase
VIGEDLVDVEQAASIGGASQAVPEETQTVRICTIAAMACITVKRVAGALGAEIHGVDLREDPSGAVADGIRQALLEHLVVFFRDQELTPAQLLAFAATMGRPVEYPFVAGIAGFPEVIEVAKLEHERVNFGGVWHSDTTYLDEPPMGSMLLAREVPPYGGDTLFANMYLAYETLSPALQEMLCGLRGVSSSAKADVSKTREDRIRTDGRGTATDYEAVHPVVRTHPETGRRSLYVNVAHTTRFDGMTEEESAPLLGYLFQHQVRPEHTCRFAWEVGSLAFWDNRCALHNPINDYQGFRRRMHRVTLAGDRPR